jgi:hypothetical protein
MMKQNLLSVLLMATSIGAFAPFSLNTARSCESKLSALMLDGQEIRGPITPLGNFVLVRTKDTLAATGGGILLPDQVRRIYYSMHNINMI